MKYYEERYKKLLKLLELKKELKINNIIRLNIKFMDGIKFKFESNSILYLVYETQGLSNKHLDYLINCYEELFIVDKNLEYFKPLIETKEHYFMSYCKLSYNLLINEEKNYDLYDLISLHNQLKYLEQEHKFDTCLPF